MAPSGARGRPTERPKRPAKLPRGRWLGDFEPLSEAERSLVANCARGEPTVLGKERPEEATEDNRIRAELIRFLALGGDEWHPVHESGVNLMHAWIEGELRLEACKVDFPLTLIRCQFTDDIILWDAHLDQLNLGGCRIRELRADRLRVEGGIFLRNGFQADGEVRLSGATIGGSLTCSGGSFQNPEGFALCADGFKSRGSIFLQSGFHASGEVRLIGAKIGGSLSCSGGRFENSAGSAISADGLEANASIFLNENFHAVGEVRLLGAQIKGNLNCGGGRFENPGGDALSMDGFIAKGGVHFSQNFHAIGEVRLIGATIGGNLACSGGRFENSEGAALSADRLDAKGSIFFDAGFHASGAVRLVGASIGGNIGCSEGRFENPEGDALIADRCNVRGSVFLNTGFEASGTVRLLGARIGGDVNCQDGSLNNPEGMAFGGDRAIVTGAVFFRSANISGRISLASCQVGTLIDDKECWPDGSLILDGFQYSQIGSGPTDARHRIAWLKKQAPQFLSDEFCPQPWEQIIKVLREMGHNWDANQIAIEKQRALYEAGKIGNRVPRESFSPKWGKLLNPT